MLNRNLESILFDLFSLSKIRNNNYIFTHIYMLLHPHTHTHVLIEMKSFLLKLMNFLGVLNLGF